MAKLISINEAASQGITLLRRPVWANPLDHLKIDIFDGRPGPWGHLYAPFNMECNGRDPVAIITIGGVNGGIWLDTSKREWVPYVGPIADSEEYRTAARGYEGTLKRALGG